MLAGFVADHEQWGKFSDEWDSALKEPPGLGYFKMTEAANMGGEFAEENGWQFPKSNPIAKVTPKQNLHWCSIISAKRASKRMRHQRFS